MVRVSVSFIGRLIECCELLGANVRPFKKRRKEVRVALECFRFLSELNRDAFVGLAAYCNGVSGVTFPLILLEASSPWSTQQKYPPPSAFLFISISVSLPDSFLSIHLPPLFPSLKIPLARFNRENER
jgi:hypothetical protein